MQFYAGHQNGKGIGAVLASVARRAGTMLAPIIFKGVKSLFSSTMQGMDEGKGFGQSVKGALAPAGVAMMQRTAKGVRNTVQRKIGGKRRRQKGKGLAFPKPKKRPSKRRVYKAKRSTASKQSRQARFQRTIPQFSNF